MPRLKKEVTEQIKIDLSAAHGGVGAEGQGAGSMD